MMVAKTVETWPHRRASNNAGIEGKMGTDTATATEEISIAPSRSILRASGSA